MKIKMLLMAILSCVWGSSSRVGCTPSENDFCERYDYEGACCAKLLVQAVNPSGSLTSEVVGQVLYKCYDIDDIIKAFDNTDVLVDTSTGGSGNTYGFICTEPA